MQNIGIIFSNNEDECLMRFKACRLWSSNKTYILAKSCHSLV